MRRSLDSILTRQQRGEDGAVEAEVGGRDRVAEQVLELGRQIEDLYWRSIDRPKVNHWLAAYRLVSATLEPHPASVWARGADALALDGPPKGLTDAVLPDEFPLSMFYEALSRKLAPVIASTKGITG